jgi:hypothetical protein
MLFQRAKTRDSFGMNTRKPLPKPFTLAPFRTEDLVRRIRSLASLPRPR